MGFSTNLVTALRCIINLIAREKFKTDGSRNIIVAIIFLLSSSFATAQDISVDSLLRSLRQAKEDTVKLQVLRELGNRYFDTKPDSALIFSRQGIELARRSKLPRWEAIMLVDLSYALAQFPNRKDSSLMYMQQAIALARQNRFYAEEAMGYGTLSYAYLFKWKNPDSAFLLAKQTIEFTEKNNLPQEQAGARWLMINYYVQMGKMDSALEVCFDGILISQKKKLPENESFYLLDYVLVRAHPTDTSRQLIAQGREWARKNNQKKYEGWFLWADGRRYALALKYPEALKSFLEAIKIFETVHADAERARALNDIGQIYYDLAEYRQSLYYYFQGAMLQETLNDSSRMFAYRTIGSSYAKLKMHDSAVYFAKKCYPIAERFQRGSQFKFVFDDIAEIYAEVAEDSIAMSYFHRALPYYEDDDANRAEVFAGIAKLFKKAGQNDSAFFYARKSLPLAQDQLLKIPEGVRLTGYIYDASNIIATYYKAKHRLDSAFVYQEIAIAAKDSLSGQEKLRELHNIEFNEQLRLQQAKEKEIQYRSRVTTYSFVSGIVVVLLIALFLFRNNRLKQRANLVLKEQKQKVESTLEQLKSTQAQLIQSEKMASLGELTAGIAHEIQNPLNFVNNFSEVNTELIDELKSELATGNTQLANQIADDIKDNSKKINHHGKRADAIVKGMLQHSRASTGQKEPTDINALADEYLRLAYHGLRAKDKSFNVKIESDFDSSIGKVSIVPQDFGRVLLNLINNSFYAVNEKKQQLDGSYEPVVSVTTRRLDDKVEVKVKDNGNGIPQKVLDKIFQPFFTTKPTGVGTGLGLSLSYDIIKAHGGEIKVETREGQGSEFSVQLPTIN